MVPIFDQYPAGFVPPDDQAFVAAEDVLEVDHVILDAWEADGFAPDVETVVGTPSAISRYRAIIRRQRRR